MSIEEAYKLITAALNKRGIKVSIYKKAASGSIYLMFDDKRMGKLRIGDHDQRKRYAYRWHLRTDIAYMFEDHRKSHVQFFYPVRNIEQLADHISNYYNKLPKKPQQTSLTFE